MFWDLDMTKATAAAHIPGLLLDCIACSETEIRCQYLALAGGRIFVVSDLFFNVLMHYPVGPLYEKYRPRNRGFSRFLVENFLPKPFLINRVADMVKALRVEGGFLLGVHRRTMDHQCDHYASSRTECTCACVKVGDIYRG
jgi:hypothetical protein